ncbi:MAG: cyclic nucleotide-binding domain-containing protein [Polyangiales bacterium]
MSLISVQQLRSVRALAGYSDRDLETLVATGKPLRYTPQMKLFSEGDAARSCFLLLTGEVDVIKATANGPQLLATLKAGSFVGQIALVDNSPRSATIVARLETVVLEIDRDAFERLCATHAQVGLRFQELIAIAGIRQLRATTARLRDLLESKASRGELLYMQGALDEWDMPLAGDVAPTLELDYGRR